MPKLEENPPPQGQEASLSGKDVVAATRWQRRSLVALTRVGPQLLD